VLAVSMLLILRGLHTREGAGPGLNFLFGGRTLYKALFHIDMCQS
jgi:hypothetical protein